MVMRGGLRISVRTIMVAAAPTADTVLDRIRELVEVGREARWERVAPHFPHKINTLPLTGEPEESEDARSQSDPLKNDILAEEKLLKVVLVIARISPT